MRRGVRVGALAMGAIAATAAVAAKIAARSNDVPSLTPRRAIAASEPEVDGAAFLDHLGAAIRIDTTVFEDRGRNSNEPFLRFHDFLRETYPRVFEACEVEVVNELSLILRWEGVDQTADPLVLMAHMDVVPVEPGTEGDWRVGAFSGEIVDGHVWGRGALDDKGPLIASLEAVEHLLSANVVPARTVYLAFGHDEEIGGVQGGKAIAATLREHSISPWFVLDEGGAVVDGLPGFVTQPVALVKVAEKGYVNVEITAKGEGGHSSIPPDSTSIGRLARAVASLEANPMPPRIGVLEPFFDALAPILDRKVRPFATNLKMTGPMVARLLSRSPESDALIRTSTAVTMIAGGVKPNVLPQEASATINFRILPGDTVGSVLDHVRAVVGRDIDVEVVGEMRSQPSGFSSTDSAAWDVVRTTIEETFPEATVAPWILTGATDSRYYEGLAGGIYGFAPFTGDPEDRGYHGTNERVRVADADRAVSFYCRLIRALSRAGSK